MTGNFDESKRYFLKYLCCCLTFQTIKTIDNELNQFLSFVYGLPEYMKPDYNKLVELLLEDKFNVYPVREFSISYMPDKVNVLLRHDVDFDNGFKTTYVERKAGIRSTYYLRLHAEEYNIFDVIPHYQMLEREGYEIGYHYEVVDLSPRLYCKLFSGKLPNSSEKNEAYDMFRSEVYILRKYFLRIETVTGHGKNNKGLPSFNQCLEKFSEWKEFSKELGIISAYSIPVSAYLSDCSRGFLEKGFKYFEEKLKKLKEGDTVQILAHPSNWRYSKDYSM